MDIFQAVFKIYLTFLLNVYALKNPLSNIYIYKMIN